MSSDGKNNDLLERLWSAHSKGELPDILYDEWQVEGSRYFIDKLPALIAYPPRVPKPVGRWSKEHLDFLIELSNAMKIVIPRLFKGVDDENSGAYSVSWTDTSTQIALAWISGLDADGKEVDGWMATTPIIEDLLQGLDTGMFSPAMSIVKELSSNPKFFSHSQVVRWLADVLDLRPDLANSVDLYGLSSAALVSSSDSNAIRVFLHGMYSQSGLLEMKKTPATKKNLVLKIDVILSQSHVLPTMSFEVVSDLRSFLEFQSYAPTLKSHLTRMDLEPYIQVSFPLKRPSPSLF